MSKVLIQILTNTKLCLQRTYEILNQKSIARGFEIQMAIYRNYDCNDTKLFQSSPFSNNSADLIRFLKGVDVEGGWGNEAIENLYNHVLNFETDVDQLIVIGDAPGNMDSEIKKKRESKGESYWKRNPRFAEVLNGNQLIDQLAARKIPVHSFYIGS